MDSSASILPPSWTAIAERRREPLRKELLEWRELPEARLTLAEAHTLARRGVIIMASRHFSDRIQLVVRPARQPL
jgi:hypothetical protein